MTPTSRNRFEGRLPAVAGFSLLELLISTVMGSMLSAGLYSFYRSQVFALRAEEVATSLKEEADVGLDFLIRELRVAGARPATYPAGCAAAISPVAGCAGFERLMAAGPQQVTLQYDYRGNGATDPPDGCPDDTIERVTYSYDAANRAVTRAVSGIGGGAPAILVREVASAGFALRYLDAQGNPIATGTLTAAQRAAVATVEVSITSSRPHPDRRIGGQVGATRASAVFLRNPPC